MSSNPGIDFAEVRSQQDQEALATVKKLLHKRLKVVVKDGRVLIGELLCIDKQANIILGNTFQQVQSDSAPFKERPIGQVLVPASQRKSCHVEVMPNEREGLVHLLQAQQEVVTSDC
ncbi:hypothetical protein WJX82_000808 [Trebouxia sp. C0006]